MGYVRHEEGDWLSKSLPYSLDRAFVDTKTYINMASVHINHMDTYDTKDIIFN